MKERTIADSAANSNTLSCCELIDMQDTPLPFALPDRATLRIGSADHPSGLLGYGQACSKSVYVAMCCDPLHHGHIALLHQARPLGRVTIGLLTDQAIETYKCSPLFTYQHRKVIAEDIANIANVIPQHSLDYVPNLLCLRPAYVVHGNDWTSGVQAGTRERVIQTLRIWGGHLVEFPYTEGITSSLLRQAIRDNSSKHYRSQRVR